MILVLVLALLLGIWATWDDSVWSGICAFLFGGVMIGLILFGIIFTLLATDGSSYVPTAQAKLTTFPVQNAPSDQFRIASGTKADKAVYAYVTPDSNGVAYTETVDANATTLVQDAETASQAHVVKFEAEVYGNCYVYGCSKTGKAKYELHIPKNTVIVPISFSGVTS